MEKSPQILYESPNNSGDVLGIDNIIIPEPLVSLILKKLLIGIVISSILAFLFPNSAYNFYSAASQYMLFTGGIFLFFGSSFDVYSMSPSLQYLINRRHNKKINEVKYASSSKSYYITAIILIALSLLLSYLF
jgi:hypothetical protein